MAPVHKRPNPTEPIMKRRFGKLPEEAKQFIDTAADQFQTAARRLRECKPEERIEEMTALFDELHPRVVQIAYYHIGLGDNNPLRLFTLDALSLWQIRNAAAPYLEDFYEGLTAEPAWGVPINLDRDDIRAQPLLALHEFIEELIVVVKKLIVPATEVQLHEGVM